MLRGADGIPDEVLIFQLDDRRFGVPLAAVREVLPSLASEPLPGAPGAIEGVIDVRGEVVPVVDVRARLGLGARAISIADHIVVARAGDRTVGLRADRALGLARVPAGAFAGAEGITALEAPVAGVARLPDGLVLVADLEAFLTEAESAAVSRAIEARAAAAGAGPRAAGSAGGDPSRA